MIESLLAVVIGGGIGTTAAYITSRKYTTHLHFFDPTKFEEIIKKSRITLAKNEKCPICQEILVPDNIGIIVPKDRLYYEFCNKEDCMALSETFSKGK